MPILILPTSPCGSPGLRVISRHVSPPSVDLYRPLPGPPLDIWYSTRYASHSAANITFGFRRSIATSAAPVLPSLNSTFFHVVPPSELLNTPRSSLGTLYLPKSATNTMSGLVGWIRIFAIASESEKPTWVQVLPASVDLYTPSPGMMLPRMHDSPMSMYTVSGFDSDTAT